MKNLLKNKRGIGLIYLTLISLVVAVFVGYLFFRIPVMYDTGNDVLVDFYANDIALIIESMQAVSGKVLLTYNIEGFEANLNKDSITVTSLSDDAEKTVKIQLLPGYTLREESKEHVLSITRTEDDEITIAAHKEEQFTWMNKCPTPQGLIGKKTVFDISPSSPTTNSGFTYEDVELMVNSIQTKLQLSDSTTGSPEKVYVTITATQPTNNMKQIIIRRPQGSSKLETDYDALFCLFTTHFTTPGFIIEEQVTTEKSTEREWDILLAIPLDQKQTFMTQRSQLAETFTIMIEELERGDTS